MEEVRLKTMGSVENITSEDENQVPVDKHSVATTMKSNRRNSESSHSRSFRCANPYTVWVSGCNWLHRTLEELYGHMGESISNCPLITVASCILFVGICSVGFLWINPENRARKLYVPQNSKSVKDLEKASEFFEFKLRQEQIIMVPKRGGDILTTECLKEALKVHRMIQNLSGFANFCVRNPKMEAASAASCTAINPLELFHDDKNFVNITGKLTDATICPGYMMSNGQPSCFNMPKMLSGVQKDKHTGQVVSAQALRITYYVRDPDTDKEVDQVERWEESFVMKVISLQEQISSINIYFSAEKSLDDAISASSSSDIPWFALTFTVMLQFAGMMVGKAFRNPLTGHSLLAYGGTFSVALGIAAGFSLAIIMQTPFVSIVGVLPFLVIGIGLDDMFIMMDQLDRQERHLTVPIAVRQVMSSTGVTITMTTITDLVAFAVSITSNFPSIRYFCIYAALTITFAFIMITTIFVALMSFDLRRIKDNRRNCLPVCQASPPKEGQPPWDEPCPQTSNRLMARWGRFLMHPKTKVVVMLLSFALLGAGIYATIHTDREFDRALLAKKDSYYKAFLNMEHKYFNLPTEFSVITEDVLYKMPAVQTEILKLSEILTKNEYCEKRTVTWMGEFLKYAHSHNKSLGEKSFTTNLKHFLNTSAFSHFATDVKFGQNEEKIEAARIIGYIKSSTSSVFLQEAMLSIRKDVTTKSKLPVYVACPNFVFYEQYAIIVSETVRNLTIASLVIFFVTANFLVNFTASFLVFFGFVSLIFELFGMMYVWGVSLNSISMINLVMAIGFAVDYSAHIAHSFVRTPGKKAEKRVIGALTNTGASVLLGGASTLVGICMTAISKSEIFQIFFKMFFSMVFLGLLHGLCFLPVQLSILYRCSAAKSDVRKREADKNVVDGAIDNIAAELQAEENKEISDANVNIALEDRGRPLENSLGEQQGHNSCKEREKASDDSAVPSTCTQSSMNGLENIKASDTKM